MRHLWTFDVREEDLRNSFESLASAIDRLCSTCHHGETVTHYALSSDGPEYEIECKKYLDPRCLDGSDCPYYEGVEELVIKKVIARMEK
jgi:hypothetical protein